MLGRMEERLTYANVTATVALFLAVAASVMVAYNLLAGKPRPGSGGAMWFIAGSSSELPSCTSCEASLPASGSNSFGSINNSANDQLSPNVPIIASDFSIHIDIAPGVATRTFVLFSRSDPSHGLRCDISGTDTTCNSAAQTLTVPPSSRLLVDAANSGGAPPTRVQLSWRATAQ
jgi:hypothetical protein